MENLEEQNLENVNQQILILYIEKLRKENKDLSDTIKELELRIETIKRNRNHGNT